MNKILLLTTSLLLCAIGELFSQKQDTVFYDRNWNVSSKKLAGYYRLETKIKTSDTLYWEFEDRFIENDQIQNEGFITKKNPEVRQGRWIWYYQNGNKEMEGDYNKNHRVGEWIFYHNDGSLKKKGLYTIKGKQDGEWIWYHPDSTLMSTVKYKEDTLIGKRVWYHENGLLKAEEYYKNGKLDSTRTEWFSTGKMKSFTAYKNGYKNGLEKVWYLDGGLKSEIKYFSGLPENEVWFSMQGDTVSKDSVVNEKEFHNLLWKITGNGLKKPSYLFGTMHVKNKSAFEFSDSMLLAFNEVEGYSMEIHPDSLYAYYFRQYDKYKTWVNFGVEVIGGEEPNDYFQNWSNSYGAYENWVMNLNQIFHRDEYNPDGMPYFVDCYLYYIATKQGKFTDGIERVEDHVNAGKNLPRNTMRYDILSSFDPEEEMLHTYEEGNLDKINALMEFLQNEEFRYRLLTVRNIKMANAIDSLAKIRPTFNTAGTAHLPGKDGVIELLKQKGYTLTPVKSVFSGDTLDVQINNLRTEWRIQRPFQADFTVESPGPLTAFSDGVVRNAFLDPIREIGVDAYQLDEAWFSSGSKSSKIETADLNYLFNYPTITEKKPIVHLGVSGLDVRWKVIEQDYYGVKSASINEEEEALYYRARVFKKDYKTVVLTVASTYKDSLDGDYANKFLNSIIWDKQIKNEPKWITYTDTVGAFSVKAPDNATYKFIHYNPKSDEDESSSYYYSEPDERKVNYWMSQDQENKFIFRYNNTKNGDWFYNDSTIFNEALGYYLGFLDKLKDSSFYKIQEYPVMEAKVKANKKHLVYYKYANRGYRNYLLIAQIVKSKDAKKKAEEFFNSFTLLPLQQVEHKMYYATDSVGFFLPKEVDKKTLSSYRFFVPKRDAYKSGNSYSYDWWGDSEISYTDDEEREINAYNNRHKFYGLDSASGITYQAYVETFSEFFKLPNRDSLFNYYESIFKGKSYLVDSSYRDSILGDSPIYYYHLNFTRKEQNGFGQLRFTQKGQSIISQRVFYPAEMVGNPAIEAFFNDLDLSRIKDTVDLFSDKALSILDSLMGKDSLSQVYARKALRFYPFDSSHVALIQKYALLEADLDTNDFENNSLDLVNLLTYINDSTTAQFVYDFYGKYFKDSLDARFNLLEMLHELDDSLSFLATFEFIQDSIKNFEDNYDEYYEVLEYFEDTLELFSAEFDQFKPWMKDSLWDLETEILTLANKCFTKDSLHKQGIKDNQAFLLEHYFSVAELYHGLSKDTSIYYDVKTNLTVFTELIGNLNIQDDSLQAVFLRLLEEKDKKLKFAATKGLFRSENALSDEEKAKMFKDLKNRYKLIQVLNEVDAKERIPSEYADQASIAEAQLYYALTNNKNSYYSARPVKIKLMKVVKQKYEGEKMNFYVYSYYNEGYGREKKIAVSNPQPINKSDTKIYTAPSYTSNDYYGSEKNLIKTVISEWIVEHGSIESSEADEVEDLNELMEILEIKSK